MKKYYDIRISLHDYIKKLYDEASENGSPLIRTMFYEFPEDAACWELKDQYMFGEKYIVAAIPPPQPDLSARCTCPPGSGSSPPRARSLRAERP